MSGSRLEVPKVADLKEVLREHCDRISLGIAGVLIVGTAAAVYLPDDPVQSRAQEIEELVRRIENDSRDQKLDPLPEVKAPEDVRKVWEEPVKAPPSPSWLWYRLPVVLKCVERAEQAQAVHTVATVEAADVQRNDEAVGPIVEVKYTLPACDGAKRTKLEILRREKGTEAWRAVETREGDIPDKAGSWTDATKEIEAGKTYEYAVRTTAEGIPPRSLPAEETLKTAERPGWQPIPYDAFIDIHNVVPPKLDEDPPFRGTVLASTYVYDYKTKTVKVSKYKSYSPADRPKFENTDVELVRIDPRQPHLVMIRNTVTLISETIDTRKAQVRIVEDPKPWPEIEEAEVVSPPEEGAEPEEPAGKEAPETKKTSPPGVKKTSGKTEPKKTSTKQPEKKAGKEEDEGGFR